MHFQCALIRAACLLYWCHFVHVSSLNNSSQSSAISQMLCSVVKFFFFIIWNYCAINRYNLFEGNVSNWSYEVKLVFGLLGIAHDVVSHVAFGHFISSELEWMLLEDCVEWLNVGSVDVLDLAGELNRILEYFHSFTKISLLGFTLIKTSLLQSKLRSLQVHQAQPLKQIHFVFSDLDSRGCFSKLWLDDALRDLRLELQLVPLDLLASRAEESQTYSRSREIHYPMRLSAPE